MRVLLDETSVEVAGGSFAAAMDAGRREAERRGRVVVEVHVDGRPAPESWLDAPEDDRCQAEEVRLVSAEPGPLVRATLLEVATLLEESRHAQRRAAELIQEDRLDEAMAPMAEAVSAWSNLQQAVSNGAALLGLEIAALEESTGKPLAAMIDDLADRLRQIKSALQSEDWTTVADILGYDMDDRCVAWADAIHAIADSIDQGRS